MESESASQQLRWLSLMLHVSSGLTVLALTVARVVWRLLHAPPPYPAERSAELTGVVRELLALREAARKQRAWAEADGIRRALVAAGIRVDDTRQACHATSEFPADRGLPAVAVSVTKE